MTMKRQKLHPEGPEFSQFGWGVWRALKSPGIDNPDGLARMISSCLDIGITTIDHADIYGGYQVEALFGKALRQLPGQRSRIEIITKCGICAPFPTRPATTTKHYNSSADHIRASVDQSLKNLGTDYLDLLLIHRPDPLMDADDTAAGLTEVVKAGKIRFVGVSNHTPTQFALLQSRLPIPLVTNQIEFSALHTQGMDDGTLDQAQQLRARPMAWSPLGGGSLFAIAGEQAVRVRAALLEVGRRYGCDDIGQVALAWLLAHPSRPVPVIGTGKIERLADAIKAASLELDRQDWFRILEASKGIPVP